MLKASIFFILLAGTMNMAWAQKKEEAQIKNCINAFFEAMHHADTSAVMRVLDPEASMQSISVLKSGTVFNVSSIAAFKEALSTMKGLDFEERLSGYDIKINGSIAVAHTPYRFFMNKKELHCGVNVFTLWRSGAGWRIAHIIDTRIPTEPE